MRKKAADPASCGHRALVHGARRDSAQSLSAGQTSCSPCMPSRVRRGDRAPHERCLGMAGLGGPCASASSGAVVVATCASASGGAVVVARCASASSGAVVVATCASASSGAVVVARCASASSGAVVVATCASGSSLAARFFDAIFTVRRRRARGEVVCRAKGAAQAVNRQALSQRSGTLSITSPGAVPTARDDAPPGATRPAPRRRPRALRGNGERRCTAACKIGCERVET